MKDAMFPSLYGVVFNSAFQEFDDYLLSAFLSASNSEDTLPRSMDKMVGTDGRSFARRNRGRVIEFFAKLLVTCIGDESSFTRRTS